MSTLVTVGSLGLAVILAGALAIAYRSCRCLRSRLAAAEKAAHTDGLTGLANRVGLYHELDQQRSVAEPGSYLAVVLLDLDGLKQINDRYGHTVGDHVLIQLAQRMRAGAVPAACTARLGGDEFVVVLPTDRDHVRAQRTAEAMAERLCSAIASPGTVAGLSITFTASAGVAVLPAHRAHHVLTAADKAMYRAKSTGSGTCRYQPTLDGREHAPLEPALVVFEDYSRGNSAAAT